MSSFFLSIETLIKGYYISNQIIAKIGRDLCIILYHREAVRVQSPPGGFGVRLSPHNALFGELPFDTVSLHAVVDGYWVLLPPLSPGEYTLTFGACSQAGCQTNIYTLIVQ
jgi:hypothetical protein